MIFPQSFIRVWFFWESRLQHKCTWWLQVLWKFWIFLKFRMLPQKNYFRILKFFENFEILWNFMKAEIFEIIGKFWNLMKNLKLLEIFEILYFFEDFRVFVNRLFRINIKRLSNPVAELKICENDSHCRSIVLKSMDRSIVKQLEK